MIWLAKGQQGGVVGFGVGAQKNDSIIQIHVEGNVGNLYGGFISRCNCGNVPVVGLLVGFRRDELGHTVNIGLADDDIGRENQIFDLDIQDQAFGQGGNNLAGCIHGLIVTDGVGCRRRYRPENATLERFLDVQTGSTMKLATWNVNSLKVRLPQVLDWLAANPVDALCLQELKLPNDKFPVEALAQAGYHAAWAGQKTYNGVAVLSRQPGTDVQVNLPNFEDPQQRVIAVTLPSAGGDIRVVSAYCPNGQALDSEKFEYKLQWFAAFEAWLADELKRFPRLAVLGDYNIAPADEDVHDPAKWAGQVHVSEPERAAFRRLLSLGLTDAFRLFEQDEKSFSWWDYRQFAFRRNAGLRIDHVLLSAALVPHCTACSIDKTPRRNEQPSDHTPVVATLDLGGHDA